MASPLEHGLNDAESVSGYLRRIWLDKAVGLIYDGYVHNVRVHTAFGERYGRDEVVADTVQQLAAFPDLRFYGEEAVWSERGGLYVSHCAVRTAHNTGYSVYGPPSGRRVRYRAVTDLHVQGGRVAEVWSIQDGLTLTRQLGLGTHEAVAAVLQHPVTPPRHGVGALELRGQTAPEPLGRPLPGAGPEAFVSWVWHEVWNRRRFDRVAELYRPDYRFLGPSGTRLRTRDAFAAYALGLLAAFPDATVRLEHTAGSGEHVAVRWRLLGTHDGPGRYGPPTGRRVNLLGITHHRLRGEQLLEECTVFDELALLAQLHAPSADEAVRASPDTPSALAPPISQ